MISMKLLIDFEVFIDLHVIFVICMKLHRNFKVFIDLHLWMFAMEHIMSNKASKEGP